MADEQFLALGPDVAGPGRDPDDPDRGPDSTDVDADGPRAAAGAGAGGGAAGQRPSVTRSSPLQGASEVPPQYRASIRALLGDNPDDIDLHADNKGAEGNANAATAAGGASDGDEVNGERMRAGSTGSNRASFPRGSGFAMFFGFGGHDTPSPSPPPPLAHTDDINPDPLTHPEHFGKHGHEPFLWKPTGRVALQLQRQAPLHAIEFRIDGSRQYREFRRVDLLQEAEMDLVASGRFLDEESQDGGGTAAAGSEVGGERGRSGSNGTRGTRRSSLQDPDVNAPVESTRRLVVTEDSDRDLISSTRGGVLGRATSSDSQANIDSTPAPPAPPAAHPPLAHTTSRGIVRQTSLRDIRPFGTFGRPSFLQMRDLRAVDPSFSIASTPSLLVRRNAIVLNLPPIKAIILSRKCIVFLVGELEYGADSILATISEWLCDVWPEHRGQEPVFEFKALEAILATVCATMDDAVNQAQARMTVVLSNLAVNQTTPALEALRRLKRDVKHLQSRQIERIRQSLVAVLDEPNDLKMLYLTKYPDDGHEEAELLLEAYLMEIDLNLAKIGSAWQDIETAESQATFQLDIARNNLQRLDLFMTVIAASSAIANIVTGLFGMNLNSDVQEAPNWFASVGYSILGWMIVVPLIGWWIVSRH